MRFEDLSIKTKFYFEGDTLKKLYTKINDTKATLGADIVVKVPPQSAVVVYLRPLEGYLESVRDIEGGPPVWYMMRGHQDKSEFVIEVEIEYGRKISPDNVKHAYVRNIPTGKDNPGLMIMKPSKPGRGAYPITYVDLTMPINRTKEAV